MQMFGWISFGCIAVVGLGVLASVAPEIAVVGATTIISAGRGNRAYDALFLGLIVFGVTRVCAAHSQRLTARPVARNLICSALALVIGGSRLFYHERFVVSADQVAYHADFAGYLRSDEAVDLTGARALTHRENHIEEKDNQHFLVVTRADGTTATLALPHGFLRPLLLEQLGRISKDRRLSFDYAYVR